MLFRLSYFGNIRVILEDNENNLPNELLKEEFTCNVCKIAKFDTMEEAIKHENQCSSIKPKNLRKEALNASGDQYATSCAMVEQGSISVGMKEVFTCDVCNTAQFDTMEEAIEHENKCRDVYTRGVCNITQFGAMEEAIEHINIETSKK